MTDNKKQTQNRQAIICKAFIFIFALVLFAPMAQDAKAQISEQRVQFAKGRKSTVIKGSVAAREIDAYVFHATQNQSIVAAVEWLGQRIGPDEQLSGFVIVNPDGTKKEDPQGDTFVANSTGDYKVIIRTKSRRSTTKYVFKLTIQ